MKCILYRDIMFYTRHSPASFDSPHDSGKYIHTNGDMFHILKKLFCGDTANYIAINNITPQ